MARRVVIAVFFGILLLAVGVLGCGGGKVTGFAYIEIEIDGSPFDPEEADFLRKFLAGSNSRPPGSSP